MPKNKILVIEDEIAVRNTIHESLKDEGYKLFFAENGKKGLETFIACNPILIILDLKMPVMGGVEFLRSLNLNPSSPCSVIVLTGHGRDEDVEKCFELGVSAFLRKPFNFFELNGLVKHSIALKRNEEELRKYKGHLERVKSSGNHLLTLISEILDLARIESGRMELKNIPFDIRSLVEESMNSLCRKAQQKNLEILIVIPPDTPRMVIGDPDRLRQVIFNLADNAIKFTEKGEIAVTVAWEEESNGDAMFQFSVRDTGIGIPKKNGYYFSKF